MFPKLVREWLEASKIVFKGDGLRLFDLLCVDHVAVPDLSAGAMENWGLVLYRESTLLHDEQKSSISNKYWVSLIVAHEIAHSVSPPPPPNLPFSIPEIIGILKYHAPLKFSTPLAYVLGKYVDLSGSLPLRRFVSRT